MVIVSYVNKHLHIIYSSILTKWVKNSILLVKWVLEKKSALIKKLTLIGGMPVMNQQEYDNICKGYGLKRELGMTWFYEHPNDGLYDTIDYVIEGTKGVITTFNTKTGEVYVAQNVFLLNYEINVDKLVKIEGNELSDCIEKLLLNYKKKVERNKINLIKKDFLKGECSTKYIKGKNAFWYKILETLKNGELLRKNEIINKIGYCSSQIDVWKKLQKKGYIERIGIKYKITLEGIKAL